MKQLLLTLLLALVGFKANAAPSLDLSELDLGAQFLPGVSAPAVQGRDPADRLERYLKLTSDQVTYADPFIRRHLTAIDEIRNDASLSGKQRAEQIFDEWSSLIDQIKPFLTPDQVVRLRDVLPTRFKIHPQISANYSIYFPTGAEFRSIFGDSPSSFGLGLGLGQVASVNGARLTLSLDSLSIAVGTNKLFVGAPQLSLVTGIPIASRVYGFARASVGPAYMDYSFDTVAGEHLAAKRLGADGLIEVGVLWGPVRVSAGYRFLTQPAGIDLSGFQAIATLALFRF